MLAFSIPSIVCFAIVAAAGYMRLQIGRSATYAPRATEWRMGLNSTSQTTVRTPAAEVYSDTASPGERQAASARERGGNAAGAPLAPAAPVISRNPLHQHGSSSNVGSATVVDF